MISLARISTTAASTPPTKTCIGRAKFLPKMVTLVEASFGPVEGEIEVMTGSS